MRINKTIIGILIIFVVFGSIYLSKSLDLWSTESNKVPITFSEGEFKGEYDPSDIRGSYKFIEVSELFNISIDVLKQAFSLPHYIDMNEIQNKDLEGLYTFEDSGIEVGNGSMKLFVALYNGLPYEYDDDYLLRPSVDILIKKGNLTQEQVKYLESHTVEKYKVNSSLISEDESEDEELVIKGKTTFKELIDFGLKKEVIERIINGEIASTALSVRDYCTNNGIQFSEIKNLIQDELDKLK